MHVSKPLPRKSGSIRQDTHTHPIISKTNLHISSFFIDTLLIPVYIASLRPILWIHEPLHGVAGLLSLALEVTRTLHNYISGVKSATQNASELNSEVSALWHVLETLVEALRNDDIDTKSKAFDDQSILRSVIAEYQKLVAAVYKKISKLKSMDKTAVPIARITWPFQKEEYQETVRTLHRYVQTLQVLLIASNWYVLLEIYVRIH
jgi:hypothetical protein